MVVCCALFVGCLLLVVVYRGLLDVRRSLLVVRCALFVIVHSLLVVESLLLVVGCFSLCLFSWLLDVRCLSSAGGRWFVVVGGSLSLVFLFVACCVLIVVCRVLCVVGC